MPTIEQLLQNLPTELSEQDARKILAEVAPLHKALDTQQTVAKTKSEQGQAAVANLLAQAKAKLGVDDEASMLAIRQQRYRTNAEEVRQYLIDLHAAKQRADALKPPTPGR